MTIKQQGGIFGRNPTFNNVEVDTSVTSASYVLDKKLTTGDGFLIKRNNATVGSLGVYVGTYTYPYIQSVGLPTDTGVMFGNGSILPSGDNLPKDATVDLGASVFRFKNAYLSGNVVVASGKGIDFSATSGTGTSELFDDYEEGTWTPNFSSFVGFTVTNETYTGRYIKCGRVVTVEIEGQFTSSDTVAVDDRFWTSGGSGELPFAPEGTGSVLGAGAGFMYGSLFDGINAFFHAAVAPNGGIYVYVTHVDGTIGWDNPFAITLTYISGA